MFALVFEYEELFSLKQHVVMQGNKISANCVHLSLVSTHTTTMIFNNAMTTLYSYLVL